LAKLFPSNDAVTQALDGHTGRIQWQPGADETSDVAPTPCSSPGELVADSRRKITGYIESLAAAGQRDAKQLTVYGLAYLKELHEGRDPRFTGC
jgi:hypothetical protein